MGDCSAVVQQRCERSLEPEGCGVRGVCEQLLSGGGWRLDPLWLHRAGDGTTRPVTTSSRQRCDVFYETVGRDERAIQLNEFSKGYHCEVTYKRFAAGSTVVPVLP